MCTMWRSEPSPGAHWRKSSSDHRIWCCASMQHANGILQTRLGVNLSTLGWVEEEEEEEEEDDDDDDDDAIIHLFIGRKGK